MGARAYLLVNISDNLEQADFMNTLRELEEMPGIDFVDPVVGSHDLVITVDTPTTIEAIASQIQARKGVAGLDILRIISASQRHGATRPEWIPDTKPRYA